MKLFIGAVHTSKTEMKEFTVEPSGLQLVGVRVNFEDDTAIELNVTVEARKELVDAFMQTDDDRREYIQISHFWTPDGPPRVFCCVTNDIKYLA